jgi:hypothetical protein
MYLVVTILKTSPQSGTENIILYALGIYHFIAPREKLASSAAFIFYFICV